MMIFSREDAQKVLQKEQTQNWLDLCLEAIVRDLPEPSGPIAYALLNLDEHGKAFVYQPTDPEAGRRFYEALERRLQQLSNLTSQERYAIFFALVPRLARVVEATWQLFGRLPYQAGWERKAFRAPAENQVYSATRLNWLRGILPQLVCYREKDLAWFAAWASYLARHNTQPYGLLFAAAIDEGGSEGDEIFAILVDSARGDHAIGKMGRHVTTGLLVATRQDGWDCIEHLLLAAQREEGLRQVILETIDEAHPQAFRRMLQLILEHDLLRFSATVRAVDVWLGFGSTVEDVPAMRNALRTLILFLDDRAARDEAIARGNPQEVYFALWTTAFLDATEAISAALPALNATLPERRLAATCLLGKLYLPETRATLFSLLDDPDLRIAFQSFSFLQNMDLTQAESDLFERLQLLLGRVDSKGRAIQSGIWPWLVILVQPGAILHVMLQYLGARDPRSLIAFLPLMYDGDRLDLAKRVTALPVWDDEIRQMLYAMIGERGQWIRSQAQELLAARPLDRESTLVVEQLLTRKSVELRQSVIVLLLKAKDDAVLESAGRLLAQSHALQRRAGLDLLNGLVVEKRQVEPAIALASAYQESHKTLNLEEEVLIKTILGASSVQVTPTRENVLGLISPEQRTPVQSPRRLARIVDTPAARACLRSLEALIEAHRTTPVLVKVWRGTEEMLLGNMQAYFPQPSLTLSVEEDEREHFLLAEIWLKWEQERGVGLRDGDGLELFRASLLLYATRAAPAIKVVRGTASEIQPEPELASAPVPSSNEGSAESAEVKELSLYHFFVIDALLAWLQRHQKWSGEILDFLLDLAETAFADVSVADIVAQETVRTQAPVYWRRQELRDSLDFDGSMRLLRTYRSWYQDQWSSEQRRRFWHLLHWLDEPVPGLERRRPDLDLLVDAYQIGEANQADVLDQLGGLTGHRRRQSDLSALSARVLPPELAKYAVLRELVEKLRSRILEIELGRGELSTVATDLALMLRYSGGMELFVCLVELLASTTIVRGSTSTREGKGYVFSHLLRASYPDDADTPEAFASLVRKARINTEQLIAAAVYAPQWAQHIEYALAWPHFVDAVWWFYAHTRGTNWNIGDETRKMWQTQVAERTRVSAEELLEGAVDVVWFQRSYSELGAERWEKISAAAQYTASGTGHGRARLFGDALRGKENAQALSTRLVEKRAQDVARALGLVPLPVEDQARAEEIARRYQVLQAFRRTSKQFGAQRRANEEIAVRIGLENLARTAGFVDPLRLQWAMEAQTVMDLRDGVLQLTEDGVQITLELDDRLAEPRVTFVGNKGNTLKTLPARLKKSQNVLALLERKREIEQQITRMRVALEMAMCQGDHFTASELLALLDHPVLARLLQNLIFIQLDSEQDEPGDVFGYPLRSEGEGGPQLLLRDHTDQKTLVALSTAKLRLAHPHDLLRSQNWHAWQRDCFTSTRAQPFKQVFRELYIYTGNEVRNGDNAVSERYTGQQVQPRQAHALLGQRGWVVGYEAGAHRTFHAEKITATLTFAQGLFTPTEVEGLTVDQVFFMRRGEYKPLPLANVPPRVFSETMRDLDLMVSVAHSGGVDPEATASTVEMRTALVSETCLLLDLQNVTIRSSHALIEGTLGHYTVHLGSAVVHRQPGGALCIIPVHSQHHGRLFLPFADNDPKTAEVITKVITLAQDSKIKDPTILEQIL